MNFKPNDKVVCVDDSPPTWSHPCVSFPNGMPVKGLVYVVESVLPIGFSLPGTGPATEPLVSIVGVPALFDGKKVGFRASRFRKVSEVGYPPVHIEQPIAR